MFIADEDKYSLKLAGDLAYLQQDYSSALDYYTEYLSHTTSETGGTIRDVCESVVRCHHSLGNTGETQQSLEKLISVGHASNVLQLR